VDNPRKAKLRRRCELLFSTSALLLAMTVLIAPAGAEWVRYVAGGWWLTMIAMLIIPRW